MSVDMQFAGGLIVMMFILFSIMHPTLEQFVNNNPNRGPGKARNNAGVLRVRNKNRNRGENVFDNNNGNNF